MHDANNEIIIAYYSHALKAETSGIGFYHGFTSFIYGKEILVASNAETNNDYEWLHVCHVRPRSLRAHMLHGKAKYQLLWVGPRALWPRDVV